MGALIELLFGLVFNNFEILLLVLFGLSSLYYKKKKEEAAESQRRIPRIPEPERRIEREPYEMETMSHETYEPLYPYDLNEPDVTAAPETSYEVTERQPSPVLTSSGSLPESKKTPSTASVPKIEVAATQQDIIRGMMWAEVFGKPRAKSPYQSPIKRNS